jgi:hypothetical protein
MQMMKSTEGLHSGVDSGQKSIEETKRLMEALVRMPPKLHEDMKVGKPQGKRSKRIRLVSALLAAPPPCLITQPNRRVRHQLERRIADQHMEQRVIGGRNRTAQACLPWPIRLALGEVLRLFDEIAMQAHVRGSMRCTKIDVGKIARTRLEKRVADRNGELVQSDDLLLGRIEVVLHQIRDPRGRSAHPIPAEIDLHRPYVGRRTVAADDFLYLANLRGRDTDAFRILDQGLKAQFSRRRFAHADNIGNRV